MTLIIPQPQLIFTLFLFLRSLVLTLVTLKVWILNVCELFRFKIKFYVILFCLYLSFHLSSPSAQIRRQCIDRVTRPRHNVTQPRSLYQSEKPVAAGQLSSPSPLLTWPASEWGVRNNRHRHSGYTQENDVPRMCPNKVRLTTLTRPDRSLRADHTMSAGASYITPVTWRGYIK